MKVGDVVEDGDALAVDVVRRGVVRRGAKSLILTLQESSHWDQSAEMPGRA